MSQFITDDLIRALGSALVQSLWEGAAAGLVLYAVLPRLKNAPARYSAAYAALLSVFFAALAGFLLAYAGRSAELPLAPASPSPGARNKFSSTPCWRVYRS